MKVSLVASIVSILLFPSTLQVFPQNPFAGVPFTFVNRFPGHPEMQLVVISSRNFNPAKEYRLSRGLQPSLNLSWFRVAVSSDSVLVNPAEDPAAALSILQDNRAFLVYVDGHGKTFNQVLERGLILARRFNLNLVLFDWPTDYVALRKTARNADEVAVAFARAMRALNRYLDKASPEISVSVIFHSMGNRILKNLVDQRLQSCLPEDLFDNVILNAAAVKQANHAYWVDKLKIQKRIYVTINDEDRPLKGAMLLRMARQLGRGFYGRPAENAVYIDFSQVAGTEHNLFIGRSQVEAENPQIFRFYYDAFHGMETDQVVFNVAPKTVRNLQ